MTEDIAQLDYESKSSDYFGNPRPEILPFVPIGSRRVLDVGCADGSFGAALKQRAMFRCGELSQHDPPLRKPQEARQGY